MITNLYILFESLNPARNCSQFAANVAIPGFTFCKIPQKKVISMPGEPDSLITCFFYAQNYFRILVSNNVVEFYREAAIPLGLEAGERQFCTAILETNEFIVRRWVITSEDWDDLDRPFLHLVGEGNSAYTLPLLNQ